MYRAPQDEFKYKVARHVSPYHSSQRYVNDIHAGKALTNHTSAKTAPRNALPYLHTKLTGTQTEASAHFVRQNTAGVTSQNSPRVASLGQGAVFHGQHFM